MVKREFGEGKSMQFVVEGDPHLWPREGRTRPQQCALIVVDMQDDYCSPGCYMDHLGFDTRRLSQPIERIQGVLGAARPAGLTVIYTRHGRAPDREASDTFPEPLSDKSASTARTAARGEPGWDIVEPLAPITGDVIVEKSTCSAFVSGELDRLLRDRRIRHLALCGNTIDVCVHSTLRSAVDLNYECLLLADCCAAVNDGLHAWAIESVKIEDGVFGTVSTAAAFVRALSK